MWFAAAGKGVYMGGGENGRERSEQLRKYLEYTLPQPKELGLDPEAAGSQEQVGAGVRGLVPSAQGGCWESLEAGGVARMCGQRQQSPETDKIYTSSYLSGGAGASGVWALKRDWEEREKDRQVHFAVKISSILGSEREEREGKRASSTSEVPAPCWTLSWVPSRLILITTSWWLLSPSDDSAPRGRP